MLPEIFGKVGKEVWIEPPLTAAFGKTVVIGDGTYINSNLTLVDDYKITIGSHVLIGPNVIIATTGTRSTTCSAPTGKCIPLR